MKILLTGGLGFIGRQLTQEFLSAGHQITIVDLPPETSFRHDNLTYISADTTLPGKWQEKAGEADTVINLAGVSIFNRWTAAYKKKLCERQSAKHIVKGIFMKIYFLTPPPKSAPRPCGAQEMNSNEWRKHGED